MRPVHVGLSASLVLALALLGLPALPASAATSSMASGASLGLFDPETGLWYLRDRSGTTTSFSFGQSGDIPLTGDWDGDGLDSPGIYRPSDGHLRVRTGSGPMATEFFLPANAMPVVADIDGDGKDTVSLGVDRSLYLLDTLGGRPDALSGLDAVAYTLPVGTDRLVGGDFDGDGIDEIAAVHDGVVEVVVGGRDIPVTSVGSGLVVAGDWDGDGVDTVAAYDPWRAEFTLFHSLGAGQSPAFIEYGSTGMQPVAGGFGSTTGSDSPPPREIGLPPLSEGDEGDLVLFLQRELTRHHLYRGPLDGKYGKETTFGVLTFHKVMELERTGDWTAEDSAVMARFALPRLPVRAEEPDRIEVDIGRQVLYIYRQGEVVEVMPVSTGGSYSYFSVRQGATVRAGTPRGDFTLLRHARGWQCDPVTTWCIYNPWSFTPYYALHGYGSVPAYPASHGCVRIPLWEADFLEGGLLFVGMPIHVWDEAPLGDAAG
jgi:N-acetylmuramoyl-L-alanine amidase